VSVKTEPADVGGCIPALAGFLSMRAEDDELVAASRFHGRWRRRGLASALLVRGCASEARARLGGAGAGTGACTRGGLMERQRASRCWACRPSRGALEQEAWKASEGELGVAGTWVAAMRGAEAGAWLSGAVEALMRGRRGAELNRRGAMACWADELLVEVAWLGALMRWARAGPGREQGRAGAWAGGEEVGQGGCVGERCSAGLAAGLAGVEQPSGRRGAMREEHVEARNEKSGVDQEMGWAGFSRCTALAGLRSGFSRFGLFRKISARAVCRFGRKLEWKTIDSERKKRNWG
jgi:hypothetical protein